MPGERPTFVDNRAGNTMAAAIRACSQYYGHQRELAIASGYFNLGGFAAIEDVLCSVPSVRILLGTEPEPPRRNRIPLPGEESEEDRLRRLSEETVQSLRIDRDLLAFDAATDTLIKRFCDFLALPKVEVRIYRRAFLHGKAFIFGDEAGVLAGSANFTWNGLNQNLELDLGQYDPDRVKPVRQWFDDLWSEAEPFDLRALYMARDVEYPPHTIYLRMLLELYGEELAGEDESLKLAAGKLSFANFQKLGIARALRILAAHGGVLIADGVGLGKTFMAGGLIHHYVQELGQRVLIVAPAGLRDTIWERFLTQYALAAEVVSFQELATDTQVGDAPAEGEPDRRRTHLRLPAQDYRLVLVDEAHALRNPDTTYYHAMRRLMAAGGVKRHLVFLTATPVNNSLWDLYYQVLLFARHDAAFQSLGIPHLRDFFRHALTLDLEDLAPNHLFPLLDAVSVRRTRHHVQKYYEGETIHTPDGPKQIRFPRPELHRVGYSAATLGVGFFGRVADAIDHLNMARYWPDQHLSTPVDNRAQQVLAGLLQSQLLKRFESSLGAYRSTLEEMIRSHERFLRLMDGGFVATGEASQEWLRSDLDDQDLESELEQREGEGLRPLADYKGPDLRAAVESDRDVLRALLVEVSGIQPESDPKLVELRGLLARLGTAAVADDRKVVVFSYYADTIRYIADYLTSIDGEPEFQPYRDRWTWVVGRASDGEQSPEDRQTAVWHFVPRSSQAPEGYDDKYDLLLSTDILAEGQNLQQCGQVVNFDLPWNPMRLVQRNGRVDRIGSPHEIVRLYCFFPATELDVLLRLEERLRGKIAQANAAVGTESPVLPGTEAVHRDFADVRKDIEAIAGEDSSVIDRTEAQIDAFSGEAFREELRRALMADRLEELRALPWGAGSGLRKQSTPCVVFSARIGDKPHWRLVPLSKDDVSRDLLVQLDAARCGPDTQRWLPEAVKVGLFELWSIARDSILRDYQRLADPAERAAAVPKAQRDAVTLLQSLDIPGAFDAVRILQAPWPQAVTRGLRSILRQLDDSVDPLEVGSQVINYLKNEGLRAPEDEELPPPITADDIHLVCYQAVNQ